MKRLLFSGLVAAGFCLITAAPASADEGWVISYFNSVISIGTDSVLSIQEDIGVDFGAQQHHGIFRTIPLRYRYDDSHDRFYALTVDSVTDGSHPVPYTTTIGDTAMIKIGDPHVVVSGTQRYVIRYRVTGALNSFADHDELYWNVDGADWGVPKEQVSATVVFPSQAFQKATCFQGATGSQEACRFTTSQNTVMYTTTRALSSGEQLTIVTALKKGTVAVAAPMLEARERQFPRDAFEVNPATLGVSLLVFLAGLALTTRFWWRHGRDRAYLGHYYLADDKVHDAAVSPFEHEPVVVEFGPPQNLRPAQLGLILDEKADTKDVTATIVDLAVRGYLTITEVPGHTDWTLTEKTGDPTNLLPYENTILSGLFAGRQEVKLSELKGTFQMELHAAESQIYQDAMQRKLFQMRPDYMRAAVVGIGVLVALLGGALMFALGTGFGWGLVGVAVILVGLSVMVSAAFMSVRTAAGRDLMQHTLGFRLYMTTAEKYRQQFAEKAEIFTQLLPYAIVFGCVNRWAKAFEGIDTSRADGWYVGQRPFQAALLAGSLESMNTSLSTAVSSAPAGRGASGFGGGGFSGGGGGGGGGGAW